MKLKKKSIFQNELKTSKATVFLAGLRRKKNGNLSFQNSK
jgi:hypothetical protein